MFFQDTGRRYDKQLAASQRLLASQGRGKDVTKDDWNNNKAEQLEDDTNENNGNRTLSEEIQTEEEEEIVEEIEGGSVAPSSKKNSTNSKDSRAGKGSKLSLSLGNDDDDSKGATWQPVSARDSVERRKQWQPMTARESSKTARSKSQLIVLCNQSTQPGDVQRLYVLCVYVCCVYTYASALNCTASSAFRMSSLLESNSSALCQMATLVGQGGLYTSKPNDKIVSLH